MNPLNILIVEDEFLVADYLSDLVRQAGHRVVGVVDCAEDALNGAGDFDVAILDIRLRGQLDGIQLAERLRQARPGKRHIYISGSSDPATRERAYATSPLAFLQKPIRPGELWEALAGAA